jgi:3-phenylpropionate/cinnamic acid dioxygenase small subunit
VTSETEICNLLYRYAETMDAGRFEELADGLFRDAVFVVGPNGTPKLDASQMVDLICRLTVRYPDGTPRTKHVITNPFVEVDEAAGTATCRSYYTVFQQADDRPLQPVLSGRYHDRFVRVDERWRFAERDYTLMDLFGDTSAHLRPLA